MKRVILSCLMFCVSISCWSQDTDIINHTTNIVMSNGAVVNTLYDKDNKTLTFDIHNNPEEVEIVVVKNGVTIESESSNTEDDNINLDLSKYKDCTVEIYVRNRRESQYVGNVDCKSEK